MAKKQRQAGSTADLEAENARLREQLAAQQGPAADRRADGPVVSSALPEASHVDLLDDDGRVVGVTRAQFASLESKVEQLCIKVGI